ncbi:ORC2-domain-containing protein, partial [Lactarius vividus]
TSFDAYFLYASRPSRTSSNVFSQLVQPLSPDEYAASLPRAFYPLPFSDASTRLLEQSHRPHLPRYLLELTEGFNLLFYGLGSKRRVLNELARACATRARAHVLVLNAFQPAFSTRDVLTALAHLPGEPQDADGVAHFLSSGRRRRLVLVVHNIDAPALRTTPKARALLAALAALDGVQVAASVDHVVGAPLLWSSTEMLARRWLWHDLTTLAPYDAELAATDPASLRATPTTVRGAAGVTEGTGAAVAGTGVGAGAGQMTETAAVHVLAAVTQRARKLFVLMGQRQLEALADAGNVEPTNPADSGEVAIAYDVLFNLARDNFIATNDTALRALLGEFRDHRLVVTIGTGAMGTGEMLWIPLRKERLKKLLD